MSGPLIVVDSDRKGKVLLDYFDQQAEMCTVQAPPFRCSYSESKDGEGKYHLRFSLSPIPSQKQFIETLEKNREREILLAFESDIPGDYLSWLIQWYLYNQKGSLENIKRLRISCFSRDRIQKALEKEGSGELEEKQEFYIRSLFDAGLGAHLQRLTGSRVGPGNRPLTNSFLTTVFLLADRETEIKMFAPGKRWRIMVELGWNDKKFKARLEQALDLSKGGLVKDVDHVKELVVRLHEKAFVIDEIERAELIVRAPAPYVISELLSDAQVLYGFQPGKTAGILKNICAGVEIQGKWQGLVSSPTALEEDCADLAAALQKTAAALTREEIRSDPSFEWSNGMLFPLKPDMDGKALEGALEDDSLKIYELIRSRALASQMKDAVGESINVRLSAGDATFRAHFNSIDQRGFLTVYQGRYDDELLESSPFSDLKKGQQFEHGTFVPEQAAGNPPERYTYETLFEELADFSVTAEPHNIMMLQGLIDHGYMNVAPDGYLVAGLNTGKVATLMARAFPKMSGINLSAYIEQTVHEVLSGRKGLDFALKQFGQTLMIQGKNLLKVKVPLKMNLRQRSSSSIIKPAAQGTTPSEKETSGQQLEENEQKGAVPLGQEEEVRQPDEPEIIPSEVSDGALGQEMNAQKAAARGSEEGVLLDRDQEEEKEPASQAEGEGTEEAVIDAQSQGSEAEEVEKESIEVFPEMERNEEPDEGQRQSGDTADLAAMGADGRQEAAASDSELQNVETDQTKMCRICGKVMILKKDQYGIFWSCSGFPSCRHSENYSIEQEPAMTCPICRESEIITKRTPTGKPFYVCPEPDCEFMAWSKPRPLPCQVCGSAYLVEKKSAAGKKHLRCPKAGCNYMQALPGEDGMDLLVEPPKSAEPVRKKVRVVRRAQGSAAGGTRKVKLVRRRK